MNIRWKIWVPIGISALTGAGALTWFIIESNKKDEYKVSLDIKSENLVWKNDFGSSSQITSSIKSKMPMGFEGILTVNITVDGRKFENNQSSFDYDGKLPAAYFNWLNSIMPSIMNYAVEPTLPYSGLQRTIFDIRYFDIDYDKWLVHYWTDNDLLLNQTSSDALNMVLADSAASAGKYIRLFSLPQRHNDDLGASLGLIQVEHMDKFYIQPQNDKKLIMLSQEGITYGWQTADPVYEIPLDHSLVYGVILDQNGNYSSTISISVQQMKQIWPNQEFNNNFSFDINSDTL